MKSYKNLIFADIVYFDLIYPSEKKRENSNRGQKMSAKICQKFLYCELTLDAFVVSCRTCTKMFECFLSNIHSIFAPKKLQMSYCPNL